MPLPTSSLSKTHRTVAFFRLVRLQEALQAAEGALQIVQPRRGDEFVLGAPNRAGRARIEVQLAADDVFLLHAESLGDEGVQPGFQIGAADQRDHVGVDVEVLALVGRAVHMDGDVRDHKQVAVDVHELHRDAALFPHGDAAGEGQRAVEPGAAEHAAVFFHGEAAVNSEGLFLALGLDAEGGRVVVRCHDEKTVRLLGEIQGDDGRAVSHGVVLAGCLQLPVLLLVETGIARPLEFESDVRRGVPGGGAPVNKVQKFTVDVFHTDISSCL